jgi:glycine cleavage system H protein
MYPNDRRYTKEHEWVMTEGEGKDSASMGITTFAQAELGDIVFVELPEAGAVFAAGDVMGTIESVKAVAEVYAPIGGTVLEVNEALTEKPELLNSDPLDKGWYCKLQVADNAQVEALMESVAYDALTSD